MTNHMDTFSYTQASCMMELPDDHFRETGESISQQIADGDSLMTRKEAARYMNFAPGTLAIWDCTKRYDLKPIRIGRSVRYRKSTLDAFLEQWLKP